MSGALPTHPTDFTMIPEIVSTGNGPGVSVATKVATSSNEALSGWNAASVGTRVILVVLRKAGGTPALGTTGSRARPCYSARDNAA